MTKQRRSFSAEFKSEAADLVLKQNYSYIEASRSLGVGESALRHWVDQVQQERQGVTPQSKALTPEQQKIQELEARIARLEREKSILKKATALLTIVDADTTPIWLKRAIRLAVASLQRRDDIVSWLKSSVDLENNTIKVSPGKTQGYDNPIHLQIKMSRALREVVSECLRSPVASPYLIHYRPKARKREQIAAKDHWTSVTPNYLSNEFSKARDAAHAYDHVPATERPTFHEVRALGAWLYEQQNFPQEYIQALMGHADAKMTKHDQDGHTEKGIEYLEVGLTWRSEVRVLQITDNKKGPTFR